MNKFQAAVYVQAMIECARCEIEAMKAANIDHLSAKTKGPLPYGAEAFRRIPDIYGIHHNAVVENFQAAYSE
jgi:hypothetical protein